MRIILVSDKLTAMAQANALQRLLDDRLDGRLDEMVAQRRQAGASWREIAAEVSEAAAWTVSWETLRTWYADRLEVTTTIKVAS